MKKIIAVSAALAIILSSLFLNGCEDKKQTKATTAATKATTSSTTKTNQKNTSKELKNYLDSFTEGDNPVYGTWKIEGVKALSYIFRNDGYAQLVMGTEADFTKLVLDSSKKTLGVAFVLGLNGTYNYTFSKGNKVLTLKSDKDSFTLTRQKDYNLIPPAPKNPKIDSDILGWWKSQGGQTYFFGSDGIMYSNNITMETCYTYDAVKGKIKAVYDYAGKVKINLDYKLKKDSLYIDNVEYRKSKP